MSVGTTANTTDHHRRDLTPHLPAVREIRDLGSFEQVATIGLGVQTTHGTAEVVGFRVTAITEGVPRLVIDVAHTYDYDRARNALP